MLILGCFCTRFSFSFAESLSWIHLDIFLLYHLVAYTIYFIAVFFLKQTKINILIRFNLLKVSYYCDYQVFWF